MRTSDAEIQHLHKKNSDQNSISDPPKPSLALNIGEKPIQVQEEEEEQRKRLRMLKKRSEKLCWGIFGSVLLSFIVFSLVLYSYEEDIIEVITKRKAVDADMWVILWCLSFVSTQPVFPGAT